VIQHILDSYSDMAIAAGLQAAALIRQAIHERGVARVVAATGISQLKVLDFLIAQPDIDWTQVVLFHLDEYIGLRPDHPASMNRYVQERIVKPAGIIHSFLLDGSRDATWVRAATALTSAPIDIAFTGIGENGHLAFNEPPADFATKEPFIIVSLAEQTRRQRVIEGDFESLDDVPCQAITMSIQQILTSRAILCIATGPRKARAVRECFAGPVSPSAPASALQLHQEATIYLDSDAAEFVRQVDSA
jgi:glucosamine-6-phosphate deaminase